MSTVIPGDGRSRQGKKDEQIRRRLLSELSKRKNRYTQIPEPFSLRKLPKQPFKGTVLTLKPINPLNISLNAPVIEAGQYMAAYKQSCCLVLDDSGAICGILTNRDIVLKAMIKPITIQKTMKISDIMTKDPVCADVQTTAMDALNSMSTQKFRHMPLLDKSSEVIGVLDISRCFFEAMRKFEKVSQSTAQINEALDSVYQDMDPESANQLSSFMDVFKEKVYDVSLESIMPAAAAPVCVDRFASVSDVLLLMVENQVSAVVITDNYKPVGIFTTKDAVLRVLAPNVDPARCSIGRVMTANPQTAQLTDSISDALRTMHEQKILNLPIEDSEGYIVGVVDVLFLTSQTLAKLSQINANNETQPEWNQFLLSMNDSITDENNLTFDTTAQISDTELAEFSLPEGLAESYHSEQVGDATPQSHSFFEPIDSFESVLPEDSASQFEKSQLLSDVSFVFKLRTPNQNNHRFPVRLVTSMNNFRSLVLSKLSESEVKLLGGSDEVLINYVDEEGDVIKITCEQDILEATNSAQRANQDVVQLLVEGKQKSNLVSYLLLGSAVGLAWGYYMLRKK